MLNSALLKRVEAVSERLTREYRHDVIPVTEEAQDLLSPYYSALLASHKVFHFYGREFTKEEVMHKCVAEQMALTTEDGFCGCDEGVVGIEVAKRVVHALEVQYGI